jgi:indolepyruvate decarboxylase
MLQDFTHAAVLKLQAASSVAILVDADVARFGQSARALELAEHLGCGVAVMGTAKGVVDETSPHYLGVYSGAFSRPEVRSAVEDAECLLLLGVRFIDSTTGSFSQKIQPERTIEINAWRSRVYPDDFEGLFLGDALAALIDAAEPRATKLSVKPAPAQQENEQSPETPLSQAWFWRRMERFYAPGDVILADNGTSFSGVSASSLPARSSVISQGLWAAIGYSLPACFGSLLAAPERRHLLFIGDGSFQLTAQELSSILRHKLTPIIFLINNDGYTIERLILGENSSYNDIQPWKYAALGNVFAAGAPFESRRVTTVGEMEDALQQAEQGGRCFFIEAIMPRMDAPGGLKKLGPVYAREDYGESWER